MEEIRRKASLAKRSKALAASRASALQHSRELITSNLVKVTIYGKGAHSSQVQWSGCGLVARVYRRDVPRSDARGRHCDGWALHSTRRVAPSEFVAGHARITWYDKGTRGVRMERAGLGPEAFYYNPPLEVERVEELKK